MTKERRRQRRLKANLFVELIDRNDHSHGRGVVVDVSLSGFAVDTEADLDVNDIIGCHIEIPLFVKAKIVRRIREGQIKRYGLRFEGQSFLDKIVMKKLLKGPRATKKV